MSAGSWRQDIIRDREKMESNFYTNMAVGDDVGKKRGRKKRIQWGGKKEIPVDIDQVLTNFFQLRAKITRWCILTQL